jgi:hypothetical protein
MKLTVSYTDEADLLNLVEHIKPLFIRCHPRLSKPAQKKPGSKYFKREIQLNPHCIKPRRVV